jgi:hypothetical protein
LNGSQRFWRKFRKKMEDNKKISWGKIEFRSENNRFGFCLLDFSSGPESGGGKSILDNGGRRQESLKYE